VETGRRSYLAKGGSQRLGESDSAEHGEWMRGGVDEEGCGGRERKEERKVKPSQDETKT
jgi:hypothetical protein